MPSAIGFPDGAYAFYQQQDEAGPFVYIQNRSPSVQGVPAHVKAGRADCSVRRAAVHESLSLMVGRNQCNYGRQGMRMRSSDHG